MILRATADITDKDGNRLGLKNDVYIHHIIVANLARPLDLIPPLLPITTTCDFGQGGWPNLGGLGGKGTSKDSGKHSHPKREAQVGGQRAGASQWSVFNFDLFIVKGNEGDAQVFSPYNTENVKSGYWIGRDDRISALAEVVNYKNVPQDVYFTLDMEYVKFDDGRPKDYLDVGFGSLLVEQCGNLYLRPPKDKMVTYNSSEYIAAQSGYIVGLTPHLHDGGLNLKMLVNGKVACTSDPIYGQDGASTVNGEKWETITSYSPCRDPIKLTRGDKVMMTSDYDLRQHKLRPGSANHGMEAEAMAIALFSFAKSK